MKRVPLIGVAVLLVAVAFIGGCTSFVPPVAQISTDKVSGDVPLTVKFVADGIDGVANFSWMFGDETSGYGQVVTHTYTKTGSYLVTLVVTKDTPCGGTETDRANVTIVVSAKPVIAIQQIVVDSSPACIGVPVGFSALIESTRPITSYLWTTSDSDLTSDAARTTFAFGSAGTKTITLTVRDDAGTVASTTVTIQIVKCDEPTPPCNPCPGPCNPCPTPCDPCDSCLKLDPARATFRVDTPRTITAQLSDWPCQSPCESGCSVTGDCGYCGGYVKFEFYYRTDVCDTWQVAETSTYEITDVSGQYGQEISLRFLETGTWQVRATLYSSCGKVVCGPVVGNYEVCE
jgi:PKD repeat protein